MTEILQSSDLGATHIDPVTMSTFINYKTDYEYKPKVTYAKCNLDASGNPVKNYFIFKKLNDKGILQTFYTSKPGGSCDDLKKKDTGIGPCEEHSALEFTISDPDECAAGKCKKFSSPQPGKEPLNIPLYEDKNNKGREALRAEIKKCSPDREFILIKDKAGSPSLVASLADKSLCKLENRRIDTEGGNWNDGATPLTQIYTHPRSGFMVGNHTHYFFDKTKKTWCIHFRPDLASTSPSCGYTDMTRSIAFSAPGEDQKTLKQKGVIKLSVKDGVPIAQIGNAASSEYSKSPPLDESGPILEVSFVEKEGEGQKTVFKSKKGVTGPARRTVTVSPVYSFGSKMDQPNTCDKNACLTAPKDILDLDAKIQCAQTAEQAFEMPVSNDGKEMCYSCNGIGSGSCGTEKKLITKVNVGDYTTKINACRSTDAAETQTPDTEAPNNAEAQPED